VLKILAPWAKGAQNGGEKGACLCNGYSEFVFFVTRQIGMKFRQIRQSVSLSNLKGRILKISVKRVILPHKNRHF